MPDDTPKPASRPTMLPERPQTPAAPLPAVPVASGASTYATITSIAFTVAQVTTTSDAPTTVVIDNITLRPTA